MRSLHNKNLIQVTCGNAKFILKDLDPTQAASKLIAKQVQLKLPKGTDSIIQKVYDACLRWEAKQRPDFGKICKMLS